MLIKKYIDRGFELEELIIKRQRHCQGSSLGSYLSTHYDFLMIQHEFVAIFRKCTRRTFSMKAILSWNHQKLCRHLRLKVPIGEFEAETNTVWLLSNKLHLMLGRRLAQHFASSSNFLFLEPDADIIRNFKLNSISFQENGGNHGNVEERWSNVGNLGLLTEELYEMYNSADIYTNNEASFGVLCHIEIDSNDIINLGWVHRYREDILGKISFLLEHIMPKGRIAVGVKDVRVCESTSGGYTDLDLSNPIDICEYHEGSFLTKYVPLAMLVMEDICAVFEDKLKLKEFVIAVPEGFSCQSNISISEVKSYLAKIELDWKNETKVDQNSDFGGRSHLPIVHSNYFVFNVLETK
jgi:hypothetical protein